VHISEGVLSAPVLAGGAALAAGGLAVGLRKMDLDRIPEVAVLSTAFFVASLLHVPVGPVGVHLTLNGLVGLLLGWMAFPSIFVALTLQALLFQFGGLTTLGVNTVVMALPAVAAFFIFRPLLGARPSPRRAALAGFGAGALGVALGTALAALALLGTGGVFLNVVLAMAAANGPVMLVEGVVTAFIVLFLLKVKPEMLIRSDR
jgi:cobalt/nickel transport system permease protein